MQYAKGGFLPRIEGGREAVSIFLDIRHEPGKPRRLKIVVWTFGAPFATGRRRKLSSRS